MMVTRKWIGLLMTEHKMMVSATEEKGKTMIDELISACFSEFCDIAGDSPCGCDACPYGRTNDDCYAIYEHDKLTTLEKKGITPLKWIPVTERLPGENGDYLVFKGSSYGGWCEVAGFAKDGSEVDEYDLGGCENVWYDYDSEYGYIAFDSVTHWMPLPSTEGLK